MNPNPERDGRVKQKRVKRLATICCSCGQRVPKAIVDAVLAERTNTADTTRRAAAEAATAIDALLEERLTQEDYFAHVPPIQQMAEIIRGCLERYSAGPADGDAESLLPELTTVFVTNAIRVHTLSNHGCKWHDCLADVCHNNKGLIRRARGEQPTTKGGR